MAELTIPIAASGDDGYVSWTGNSWPPSTTSDVQTSNQWMTAYRSDLGPPYESSVGLMRFDVTELEGTTVSAALLRVWVNQWSNDTETGVIRIEWYASANWPIDISDHTFSTSGTAHNSTDMSTLPVGGDYHDFDLNVTEDLEGGGTVALRLHVNANVPALTGDHTIQCAAYDHATHNPPELVVTYTGGGGFVQATASVSIAF